MAISVCSVVGSPVQTDDDDYDGISDREVEEILNPGPLELGKDT